MKQLIVTFFLLTSLWAQSAVESSVLQKVSQIFQSQGGVTFSSLYNDDRFAPEERAFLGRLYEIFFAIPGYLKTEYESTGSIPSRTEMAKSFGVSTASINLLLKVMETDSRVPNLFTRNPDTGELASLNLEQIESFLANRGSQVKVTQWEGQPLPPFELETFTGSTLSKADLIGKNALLYFWFTGCPPCVRIAPILAKLHQEFQEQGVRFLGLNADEVLNISTEASARADYVAGQGIEFANVDLDDSTKERFGNINVYPTLFIVNEEGIIVSHLLNFQSEEKLRRILEELVGS